MIKVTIMKMENALDAIKVQDVKNVKVKISALLVKIVLD